MSRALARKSESAQQAIPMTEAEALISMIERAAKDPTVDIDKMQRLFDMHERISNRAAESAFNRAMSLAQEEIAGVVVTTNKRNDHTKSNYADLFAIAEQALPIAHKHGFGLSFSECPPTQPNCMGIACEAMHSSGFSKRYTYNIPIDKAGSPGKINKTDTQAYGSTFTYGRRYATCGVFNIAIKDKDGNKPKTAVEQDDTPISDEQAEIIRNRITAKPDIHNIERFLAFLKVESLSDLLARDFKRAMALLDGQERELAKANAESKR